MDLTIFLFHFGEGYDFPYLHVCGSRIGEDENSGDALTLFPDQKPFDYTEEQRKKILDEEGSDEVTPFREELLAAIPKAIEKVSEVELPGGIDKNLHDGEILEFPTIGTLFDTKEPWIQFRPDGVTKYSVDARIGGQPVDLNGRYLLAPTGKLVKLGDIFRIKTD